ncbi:pilus assembly protein PilP [Oceanimonas marisflavi]|uniref:pilus assembly protein PilP n=1 Tax=Oceanimonas marisflavi TaxID=2059724 RepID=UPI000D30C53E|nr:pilus assembly protein PilP [Oceanimonas marisflavi]
MRTTLTLLLVLGLGACTDQEDLRQYVAEVRSRPSTPPEPIPAVNEYVPESYAPVEQRSPFATPRPETTASQELLPKDCEQPDTAREKQPLERYSLGNLSMRGTLKNAGGIRALVLAQDGETHLVAAGDRLGLNYGEVTAVSGERIRLKEYVPDGRGCWNTRETTLELVAE